MAAKVMIIIIETLTVINLIQVDIWLIVESNALPCNIIFGASFLNKYEFFIMIIILFVWWSRSYPLSIYPLFLLEFHVNLFDTIDIGDNYVKAYVACILHIK